MLISISSRLMDQSMVVTYTFVINVKFATLLNLVTKENTYVLGTKQQMSGYS